MTHGGRGIRTLSAICWTFVLSDAVSLIAAEPELPSTPRGDLVVIVGSPGEDEYATAFRSWAARWQEAAEKGGWRAVILGGEGGTEPRLEAIESTLTAVAEPAELPLWVVLIGHGTFDGRVAKFALPGPDLEPDRLQAALEKSARPGAVVLCFSASAPFLPTLSGPRRIVVSATNSGNEVNYSRFGAHLSEAIGSVAADLDKDGQTSLLEAFLFASRTTETFYKSAGRLVTEHSLIDDNGDGRPIPPEGFSGLRPVNRNDPPGTLPDGPAAHQWHLIPGIADAALSPETLARRNALELEIAQLRGRKESLSEAAYLTALKSLLLEMADLLVDDRQDATRPPSPPLPERT